MSGAKRSIATNKAGARFSWRTKFVEWRLPLCGARKILGLRKSLGGLSGAEIASYMGVRYAL